MAATGIQYLPHRNFGIQTGGVGDRTTNLLISKQPALPLATALAVEKAKTHSYSML